MSKIIILISVLFVNIAFSQAPSCKATDIKIQVLGSGGPELTENRSSSSYLLWFNGKATILIDAGGGSALRYGQSHANWQDLQAVLFTHFHADHSSDFPALIKASWFGERQDNLPVFGPYGNTIMPSTKQFLTALFGEKQGAFKYLSDFYNNQQENTGYHLIPHDIANIADTQKIFANSNIEILAQRIEHGPIPAVAYIIKACDKTIVFSGDTNGKGFENLKLNKTDIFIAHNAIPENAGSVAKFLHMTPTQIGEIATHLNTKKLVLSHRMKRTIGTEKETIKYIKKSYQGQIKFANDLDVFTLDK